MRTLATRHPLNLPTPLTRSTLTPYPPHQQESILDLLVERQLPKLRSMPLRTSAALVLALAKTGYYQPAFFCEAAAASVADLASLQPWEVPVVATVLAAGFSAAGHYDEGLFDALAARVRLGEGDSACMMVSEVFVG